MNKKTRSPAYPGMDLAQAIQKTHEFYAANRRYAVERTNENPVAYRSIGYTGSNGASKRALAALLAFGLLERIGSGDDSKVQVSALGYNIVALPQDDPERLQAIQQAAREPRIYDELLTAFSDGLPPADSPLHSYLIKAGYNVEAVSGLISDFRATVEFAFGGNFGKMVSKHEPTVYVYPPVDQGAVGEKRQSNYAEPRRTESESNMKELTIPLGNDSQAILKYPTSMTDTDFDFLLGMLQNFKSRITKPDVNAALRRFSSFGQEGGDGDE